MPHVESELPDGRPRANRMVHLSRTTFTPAAVILMAGTVFALCTGCGSDKKTPPPAPAVVVPPPAAEPEMPTPDTDPGMPTPGGIAPETVTAFDKSGARLVAFTTPADRLWEYITVVNPVRDPVTIPAFAFPADELPKGLPEVRVPFGVVFLGFTTTGLDVDELCRQRQLTALDLGSAKLPQHALRKLSAMPQLKGLSLKGNTFPVEELRELREFKHLKSLDVQGTKINDGTIADILPLCDLTALLITNSPVTDSGLKPITGYKSLRHLALPRASVSDAGLTQLQTLDQLESLDLSHTKVTDAGLATLANFPKLKRLRLGGTAVTDAGLARHPKLRDMTDAR
jgi:Leucine-rich repeat (LRR) protein